MISGKYRVTMYTPMGIKTGTLTLIEGAGALTGSFYALGRDNLIHSGTAQGDSFQFSGVLNAGLIRISYKIKGTVTGDMLKASAATKYGDFPVTGERI